MISANDMARCVRADLQNKAETHRVRRSALWITAYIVIAAVMLAAIGFSAFVGAERVAAAKLDNRENPTWEALR